MRHMSVFVIFLLLSVAGCRHATEHSPVVRPTPPGAMEKTVASAGNTFGVSLFKAVSAGAPGTNVFISPLSVAMALGMTLNGAAGPTRDSMAATLALSGFTESDINGAYRTLRLFLTQDDPTVTLQIANSIWYKNTFSVLQAFLDTNRTTFDAEVHALDFASPDAVSTINAWVSTKTNGKIPLIINFIPDGMMMYLINAVYFKGTWTTQFDPNATQDAPFHLSDGSSVTCRLMHQKTDLWYAMVGSVRVVDMPYGSGDFRMKIILPPLGADIDSLAGAVTPGLWTAWSGTLAKTEVDLFMPRFELTYETLLNAPLSAMGMGIAFSDFADFTRISSGGGLQITEVKHKTYVKVDEEGTEAAAVTSVGVGVTSVGGGGTPVVRIDHPFLFAITEQQSGTILFIGKVSDPTRL